ncbi:sensor histidine kinase [Paenibacillus sp. MBLB4367]|uniref:cache domain-containing sensor histidine kinase n=1 Tax=Paenibacillus sp. MBLB4367 TaxID=3384767 RepID=UPI0039082142
MRYGRELAFPFFKFKSIQSSIFVAFSALILCSLGLTSLIYYSLTTDAVKRNSASYIGELIKQVNVNIQSYITNMENISLLALTNKDVKYYISDSSFISDADRRPYEKRISDLFQSILLTRKDIASIMVFGYNGRFVSDRRITSLNPNTKLEEQAWYRNAKQEGGKSVISSAHVQNIIQNEYRWVVSLSRELKSADGLNGEGIFLVDLNLSVIDEICKQIQPGKRGYVFIVDKDGNIVYHPQQQLIYSNLKSEQIEQVKKTSNSSFTASDGDGERMYSVLDTDFGWKIVGVAYTNELLDNKDTLQLSYLLLGVFGLAITLLLSIAISLRLTRPIRKLQENMKQVERGNFNIRADIEHENEIGQLSRAFNIMVSQTKELMERIISTEESKRKNELKVLQAQINPHFLYNTLDSIIWMAEGKKHEEVVLMTSALAKLFRSSINKDDELVPIRVEIDHITNYLLIQKMRYKDRLDYQIYIAPDIMPCKTIKIILQPFVENAIYHGIKNMEDAGLLTITGRREGDRIVFTVTDNGMGMMPDKVAQLLRPVIAASANAEGAEAKNWPLSGSPGAKGLGIANVNERIKLYFGHDYGIAFESEPGVGTTVTIVIPVNE